MLAHERKYRTLLPCPTDSLAIEEDLKWKLNRRAFDEVERRPRVKLAKLSPPLLAPSNGNFQLDGSSSRGSSSGSESLGSSPGTHRIRKRRNMHGGSDERRHICRTCYKGFTTSGHLARHNRIHTGEKNHKCPYEGCDQRFSRHDNCIQHYRAHLKRELRTSEAIRTGNNST